MIRYLLHFCFHKPEISGKLSIMLERSVTFFSERDVDLLLLTIC